MVVKHTEISKKVKDNLENLTSQDFRNFGVGHIAYINPGHFNGKDFYTVYAADGKRLYTADTLQDAIHLSRQDDLEPVTIH